MSNYHDFENLMNELNKDAATELSFQNEETPS
jgi:hypothetical protein